MLTEFSRYTTDAPSFHQQKGDASNREVGVFGNVASHTARRIGLVLG